MRVVSCQKDILMGNGRELGVRLVMKGKGKKGILGIKWKVWMNVDLNLARFILKVCSFFSS